MDNPEQIIDLLLNQYSVKKSRAHLQFEAQAMRPLVMSDLIEIGHMNPGRWQRMAETFLELGMVDNIAGLENFIYDPNPPQLIERLRKTICADQYRLCACPDVRSGSVECPAPSAQGDQVAQTRRRGSTQAGLL
jgi:hypothetical protein